MIRVHVRFTDDDGTFWTSEIRNPTALAKLLAANDERKIPTFAFSHETTAAVARECFHAADVGLKGSARGHISWGPAGQPHCFACEIAKELPGMFDLVEEVPDDDDIYEPVIGGFPLLDAEPPADGWKKELPAAAELAIDTDQPTWLARLAAAVAWFFAPTIPQGSST